MQGIPTVARKAFWLAPALGMMLLVGAGCSQQDSIAADVYMPPAPVPGSTPDAVAPPVEAPPAATPNVEKRIAFQVAMHRLWEDHIAWTRSYIISSAHDLKDKDLVAARLMKNQEDIGAAMATFYGDEAGDKLTALLKEHINGAVKVLDAAKGKDKAKLEAAIAAWRANGDDIAAFLHGANPDNWPLDTMKAGMKMHLDTTIEEATARLAGKYDDDIKAYDAVKEHMYVLADALADGVIKQFPEKF